ncbi:MAG: META domain-containing protein [Alphaproteobacteria bacterium]|nr:META domain-containing protein [Alphaproteobacteria bacterium]
MKKLLSTLIAAVALTACSETAQTPVGKTYALLPEKAITITFDAKEPRFYGQAVNNYFGEYKIDNKNITLNLQGSTMMAAPEPEMKKETDYFQNLGKIKTYTLNNKTLELKGNDVTLNFVEQ